MQTQDERYERVVAELNAEVDRTHREFRRVLWERDLEEDEDARMQLSESCLDAECDWRRAVAKRDQVLAIT